MTPQITILHPQTRTLFTIAAAHPGALGVRQSGSVLHVSTGTKNFIVNPNGTYKEEELHAQEND